MKFFLLAFTFCYQVVLLCFEKFNWSEKNLPKHKKGEKTPLKEIMYKVLFNQKNNHQNIKK